ncbi:uncharacterized protein BN723_00761 [Enterocloster bolteae CAG:59]|nr:uncharacterized protein BN723_00761 [Enterocloster bolteae CAG:59]
MMGESMKKYICLRDDDTNFFTSEKELINGYRHLWGNIPVTLATIPFVHGSEKKIMDFDLEPNRFQRLRQWEISADVDSITSYHKLHPIGANKALISELKKQIQNGKIEIAQHGVTHRYTINGPEMQRTEVSFQRIKEGKEYLEKVFGTEIGVFIPPSNTIDCICAKYIKQLQMKLFTCGSIKWDNYIQKIIAFSRYLDDIKELVFKHNSILYPTIHRMGIPLVNSITYGVYKQEDEIYKLIIDKLNQTGFASLATHYRLLQGYEYQKHYINLVDKLSLLEDVEFVTATKYYQLLENRNYA